MGKQYGYLQEKGSYNSTSSNYEIGWSFSIVKKIYFAGFRYKSLGTGNFVFHLWDVSSSKLLYASEPIVAKSSGIWQDIDCKPIILEKDKIYLISFSGYSNNTYYYYTANSNITLNTDFIKYVGSRYGNKNYMPTGQDGTWLYGLDLIFVTSLAKYLVSSKNKYYTVINDELSEITVGDLTASTFEEYGVDEISSDLLKTLVNPRLYAWYEDGDSSNSLKCNIKATPKPQILYSDKCDLTNETILGIENLESTFEGSPLLAMSFDEKQTWEAFNGTEWVTLQEDATGSIPNVYGGLSVDQWAEKLNGVTSIYFRVVIPTAADKVTSIKLNFLN